MDDKSFNVRIPKRWVRIAMIVGVTALVVAPLTAIASHSFTDVPDSNIFHADIEWLADAGVTKGCNPPSNTQFCPKDNVTREAMSAFMRRFAKYIDAEDGSPAQADNATTADNADTLDGKEGSAYTNPAVVDLNDNVSLAAGVATTELAELTITLPSGSGVAIWGMVTPQNTGVNSLATFWLQVDNATCTFDVANFYSVMWGRFGTGSGASSTSIQGAVDVPAGSHTVTMCGFNFSGATFPADTSLMAMYATDVSSSGFVASTGDGGEGLPSS